MLISDNSKLHLRMRAYDSRLLENAASAIINIVQSVGTTKYKGPISLPRSMHMYTVNRSPHIDKNSREHLVMIIYNRLLVLVNPCSETMQQLFKLNLPSGVDIDIKT